MDEILKNKLKDKLIKTGIQKQVMKNDKRLSNKSFSENLKRLSRMENAILNALDQNDESILVEEFGEFYKSELGV